jgi:hypothetical protein
MKVAVGNTDVDVRVEAIFSMPRLGFTANHQAWATAFLGLGIRPTFGTGAFWDQVLTRTCEKWIDECEYLLTVDYDTFFTQQDLEHLFALALTFQCDAITGLQTKREDGRPMLTLKDTLDDVDESKPYTVPKEWFAAPVNEVDTAHFGCTIISTAALKRMPKPWFHSKPGPDGCWNEGRTDADISFWRAWRACGNRIYVTPRVVLGHGEYVVSWPGKDLQKPVFQYCQDFNDSKKRPDTAWKAPE